MAVSDFKGPDGHLLCDVRRSAMRVSHPGFWKDKCITASTFGRPISIKPRSAYYTLKRRIGLTYPKTDHGDFKPCDHFLGRHERRESHGYCIVSHWCMVMIRGRQMGDPLVFISAVRLGTMERTFLPPTIRVGPGLIDIIVSDRGRGRRLQYAYAVYKKTAMRVLSRLIIE